MRIVMLAPAGSLHTRRWCAGLKLRGHDIHLVSNSHMTQPQRGIATTFMNGASAIGYIRNIPAVQRLIKRLRPDIVHAHYATGYGLWGSVQRIAPLVLSVWGTDILDAQRRRLTVAPITRRALKAARIVTATSRFLVERTVEFCPEVGAKIVHVPFGVAIDENPRTERRNDDGIVEFIFAKLYLKNYAPDLVIESFAAARDRMPPARLRLIGGGLMSEDLKRLVEALRVADCVTIEGFVPPEQAAAMIRKADIMVMPSYHESFGVAAVEAALYGLPVIATDVGGIPEIIRHERNGLLIEPGDRQGLTEAMIRLAGDENLRHRMGEEGSRYVREHYDERLCLDKMEAVYRKAVVG